MMSTVAGRNLEFGPGDYDAIERAVMETPRGRWFLGQRDKRQRMDETQRILDALKKLEAVLAAPSTKTAAQAPALKNLKYFKQNEAIFVPAEAPQSAEAPAVKTGARLVVYRNPPSGTAIAANPAAPPLAESRQLEPEALSAPAPSPGPEPAMTETGEKRRIVIIRRAAAEPMEVPLQSQLAAGPAP